MIKRFLRDKLYHAAGQELAAFLEDHEEELVREFREELARMDREIPDEESFVDVRMVPLGETILRASLRAIRDFLRNKSPEKVSGASAKNKPG
jgi:hypothetical protein